MDIQLKRVREPAEKADGFRIFVDKFWPRGIKKEALKYDLWAKGIVPSDALRKFFHEDPEANWKKFEAAYGKELRGSEAFAALLKEIAGAKPARVTLVFGFHDAEKNHAAVIQKEMRAKLR